MIEIFFRLRLRGLIVFNLIQFIIERVISAAPWKALKASKDERQLNRIGEQLFIFYMALNKIISNGDALVAEIEQVLNWTERKGSAVQEIIISDLYYRLVAQGVSIVELSSSAGVLATSLELVAPGPYAEVLPLIRGKAAALQEIAVALTGGYSTWVGRTRPFLELDHLTPPVREVINIGQLSQEVDAAFDLSVTLRAQKGILKPEQLTLLRNFYDTQLGRDRLDALHKAASDLREAIIANFSVKELMLRVGDKSLVSGMPFTVLGDDPYRWGE
jgi:hypothetical protein